MPIGNDVLRTFQQISAGPEGWQAFRALWADDIVWRFPGKRMPPVYPLTARP